MAFRTGIIKLRGKLGDLIHYERDGKELTRSAPESYNLSENSKKTSAEFISAVHAATLVYSGLRPFQKEVGDRNFTYRLNGSVMSIVYSGPEELKGSRRITDGDIALLKQLEFNIYTPLEKLMPIEPIVRIEPTEMLTVRLPKGDPTTLFCIPPGFAGEAVLKFRCCVFYFDIENGRFTEPEDLKIPLDKNFPGGTLEIPLDAKENKVILLAAGLLFTKTKGTSASGDRKYYAGKIIEAVNVKDGNVVKFKYPDAVVEETIHEKQNKIAWKLDED